MFKPYGDLSRVHGGHDLSGTRLDYNTHHVINTINYFAPSPPAFTPSSTRRGFLRHRLTSESSTAILARKFFPVPPLFISTSHHACPLCITHYLLHLSSPYLYSLLSLNMQVGYPDSVYGKRTSIPHIFNLVILPTIDTSFFLIYILFVGGPLLA